MRREPDVQSFLAHLPLFRDLAPEAMARLAGGTERRRLRRGEFLFRRGEASSGIYAVVHGRVKLSAPAPRARERLAAVVEAGRSFGEAIMFLGKPYIVDASALTDALVLHVAREAVLAELDRNPVFARRVIALLAAKLHANVRELDLYALGSGAKRFAAWLLQALPPGVRGPVTATLPAAKRAIASQLNVSPEHLSRILRELALEGLVEVRGRKVRILDVERLREWVGADA